MTDENLSPPDRMLANFLLQKQELLKRNGMKNPPIASWERAKTTHGKHMAAAAELADRWSVDYDVFMEAAFAWAKRQRQPDGPFPMLLSSVKYMTKALQDHLQLPYEVIVEGRSRAAMVRRMEEAYLEHRDTLRRSCENLRLRGRSIEDLSLLSGVNALHLLLFIIETIDAMPVPEPSEIPLRNRTIAHFIPEALPALATSKTAAMWFEGKGYSYERLADLYNENKP